MNVCDTDKQPDAIGIRASMPGTPKGVRLSMRFRVQYLQDKTNTWIDVEDADSGWRVLGSAKGTPVESGWSFNFAHPPNEVTLRGVVRFRWRRGRQPAARGRGRHGAGPPLQRRRRPRELLRRDLRTRQLSEQPRVVGDDPGDAQPLQAPDPRAVVDGPDVELAARLADRAHEAR